MRACWYQILTNSSQSGVFLRNFLNSQLNINQMNPQADSPDSNSLKHSLVCSKRKRAKLELIPGLRKFQVSYVARYLSAQEKMTKMALINSLWRDQVFKQYMWSKLPERGPHALVSHYIPFVDNFIDFRDIEFAEFPGEFVCEKYIECLEQCSKIGKISFVQEFKFHWLRITKPVVLRKIRRLELLIDLNGNIYYLDVLVSPQFWEKFDELQELQIRILDWHYTEEDFNAEEKTYQISLAPLTKLRKLQTQICQLDIGKLEIIDLPSSLTELAGSLQILNFTEIKALPNLEAFQIDDATQFDEEIKELNLGLRSFTMGYAWGQHLSPFKNLVSVQLKCIIYKDEELKDFPHLKEVSIGGFNFGCILTLTNLPSLETIALDIQVLRILNSLKKKSIKISQEKLQLNGLKYKIQKGAQISDLPWFIFQELNLKVLKKQDMRQFKSRNNSFEVLKLGSQISQFDITMPPLKDLYLFQHDDTKALPDNTIINALSPRLSFVRIILVDRRVDLHFSQSLVTLEIHCRTLTLSGNGSVKILQLYTDKPVGFHNNKLLSSIQQMTLTDFDNIGSVLHSDQEASFTSLKKLTLLDLNVDLLKLMYKKALHLQELELRNCSFSTFVEIPYCPTLMYLDISALTYNILVIKEGENTEKMVINKGSMRCEPVKLMSS